MSDYTTSEILNEIALIFRANLTPGREGGTLNTQEEYEQLLEISSLTLLLQNDAIFYLASLAKNRLNSLVIQEINLIEDILVGIEDLSQIGEPVKDTATLSNANTALLALDAAGSVEGRPETTRFANLMDKFAEQYRKNVVSQSTQNLVRPREGARNLIVVDLARLKTVHDKLLSSVVSLRDLLDSFVALDIPTKVSTTALTSVRQNLDNLSTEIEDSTDVENVARSRQSLLTTLASKVGVQLISEFSDPRSLKIRSPQNPIPPTAKHTGRVTGEGESASILSSPGPWQLPMSASLDLKVNGGTLQSVAIDEILGSVLNGRNQENFEVTSTDENLNVIVDPVVYPGTINTGTTSVVTLNESLPLGFKHLGALVSFPSLTTPTPASSDFDARIIVEMRSLQSATVGTANDLGDERWQLIFNTWVAFDEAGVGLGSRHVGAYIYQPGTPDKRFEILEIVNANEAIVSVPTTSPTQFDPITGIAFLLGQIPSLTTKFVFKANATIAVNGSVLIGPTVKTVQFSAGSRTVANLISDINGHQGNYDIFTLGGDIGQALNQHVQALPVAGDPKNLALLARSRFNPYLQISSTFPRPKTPIASITILGDSAHHLVGFLEGELDTDKLLTPSELAAEVSEVIPSLESEVVITELGEGTLLSTTKDTKDVEDLSINFNDLVISGDQIEILSGVSALGTFQIDTVSGSTLTLLKSTDFPSSEPRLRYRLFREQVKISTVKKSRGSSLEVVAFPSELGFTVGVYLGSIPQFEAVDKLGNKLSFDTILSGDLLRLVGSQVEFSIEEVQDELLVLVQGLPSDVEGRGFEIRSQAAKDYDQLSQSLETYTTSPNLLLRNNFDENLDAVDNALTRAIIPGQNFASSRNQARVILAQLLALMTGSPRRGDEYTAPTPVASLNLESILASYNVASISAVDLLVESFRERKYTRSALLLTSAKIVEFYETNEETGSFGGAVMTAAKGVDADLPGSPTNAYAVDQEMNLAVSSEDSPDADLLFEDTEDLLDIPE